MTGPRIVLVARRFWPLADDDAALATRLAAAFAARDWPITVLTSRGLRRWPERFDFDGVTVVRVYGLASNWWSSLTGRRSLHLWFQRHRAEYDAALVLGLDDNAAATIEAGRRLRFPVAVRGMHVGPGGECHQQMHTSAGMRMRRACARAGAIIAGSELAERELIAAGYPRERIHRILPGMTLGAPRTRETQAAARAALASATPALQLPAEAWLALVALRTGEQDEVDWLFRYWRQVVETLPRTYLWLLGDRALQEKARKQLQELNLLGRIVPVGSFDDDDDFFSAADVLLEPAAVYEPSRTMLQAMAAELPIVSAIEPSHPSLVIDGRTGRRVPPRNIDAWVAALEQLQSRPDWSAELGRAGREVVRRQFDVAAELDKYAALFAELLSRI